MVGQPAPHSISWSHRMRLYGCIGFATISFITVILGDPIEVLMLHENGTSERAIVGPDLRAGQCVQLLIPGNTFHTARVIPEGVRGWFLGASTEWPGVERVDVEIGDVEALAAKYPDVADDLRAFQQGRGD
jgi:predicted cupin superfamily sugar epimerase